MNRRDGTVVAAVVSIVLFAAIRYAVSRSDPTEFDLAVRSDIHAWSSPALTWFMRVVTELGDVWLLAPVGIILAWRAATAGRRREAVLFIIAWVGAEALLYILRPIFHRPRPEPFFGLTLPHSFSFPSGHTLFSTAYYGALAELLTTSGVHRTAAAALVGAIGLSRVYLGFHYPTDVLAGYVIGFAWLCVLRLLALYRTAH